MDWGALTAIGTLALAVVTLATVIVTVVITTQDRRRADKRYRGETLRSDADLVADIGSFLRSLEPSRRAVTFDPELSFDEIWAWLSEGVDRVEIKLTATGMSHPSEAVRDAAMTLERNLRDAFMAGQHVAYLRRRSQGMPEPRQSRDEAEARYKEAVAGFETLKTAIGSAAQKR